MSTDEGHQRMLPSIEDHNVPVTSIEGAYEDAENQGVIELINNTEEERILHTHLT